MSWYECVVNNYLNITLIASNHESKIISSVEKNVSHKGFYLSHHWY